MFVFLPFLLDAGCPPGKPSISFAASATGADVPARPGSVEDNQLFYRLTAIARAHKSASSDGQAGEDHESDQRSDKCAHCVLSSLFAHSTSGVPDCQEFSMEFPQKNKD
jgi:hypothetical protein